MQMSLLGPFLRVDCEREVREYENLRLRVLQLEE